LVTKEFLEPKKRQMQISWHTPLRRKRFLLPRNTKESSMSDKSDETVMSVQQRISIIKQPI